MPSYFEWRFVVEEEVSPDIWRSTNSFSTQEEAVRVAKDSTRNSRVRQFKTTYFTDEAKPTVDNTEPPIPVPTISFFCPTHPDRTSKAFATSCPRCPDCRQEMFRGTGMKP